MTLINLVFVGVCPEECKAVSQWSNTDGGCWIRRVASSRPSNKGDIIGCGINKNSQMFFVVDGEIEYEDFLPNEFCTVYPFVITNVCWTPALLNTLTYFLTFFLGLNCFTISLDIPNPSKGGPWIATPTSTKKSFELIGNPFGQINYSNLPKLVDSSLWRLPADVLTEIRKSVPRPRFPIFWFFCQVGRWSWFLICLQIHAQGFFSSIQISRLPWNPNPIAWFLHFYQAPGLSALCWSSSGLTDFRPCRVVLVLVIPSHMSSMQMERSLE